MAITSVSELAFESGTETEDSSTYIVHYQVETSSVGDGPKVVLNHPTFRVNRSYSFAGESDAFALLKSRSAALKQRERHRQVWVVTCTFEANLPEASGESWEVLFSPTSLTAEGEFLEAVNRFADGTERSITTRLGGLAGGDGYFGAICNSAFTPNDPQPQVTSYNLMLRRKLTINKLTDKKIDAVGAINSKPYYIHAGPTFQREFPKYTLRINDIVTPPIEFDDKRLEAIFEVEYNPRTWLFYDLDRGRARKLTAPSDDGETVSSSVPIEAEDGEPPVEPITDARGNVMVDPVNFDGFGLPLTKPDDLPVYNKWLLTRSVDFKDIIKA